VSCRNIVRHDVDVVVVQNLILELRLVPLVLLARLVRMVSVHVMAEQIA